MRFFVFTYPEQLRAECKAFFKEMCDVEISDETADQYLDSFADLYVGMENILKNQWLNFV